MRTLGQVNPAKLNVALWTVQVLLALLFLFAGGAKLVLPIAELTKDTPLPGWFIRFIGVAEIAGALGLILPGVFRTRRELTPLAACGLVLIMSGAATLSLPMGAAAAIPLVTGVLAALVAVKRYGS